MNARIASVAGPFHPMLLASIPACLCLALLTPPAAHAQIPTTSITVSVEASDCCNLSAQIVDPLGPDGPWWTDPDYIRAAHLPPDLQQRLAALYAEHVAAIRANQLVYAQQKAALKTLLSSPTATEDALDTQISRIEQARSAAAKAVALAKLAIRAQLSPDQWKQVTKLQTKRAKSQ